jgi:hypothetical protein
MRKLSLLIAVVIVLAGLSVNAQISRSGPKGSPPIIEYPEIVLEDEDGAGFIRINPGTGAYKYVLCEYDAYTIESVGQVKIDGCNFYLTDLKETHRTLVSVNLCSQEGKCAMEMYKYPAQPGVYIPLPMEEIWTDSNLLDNAGECIYSPPNNQFAQPPEPEGFGEVIIQNDADGSFLLIDTSTGDYKFLHCEDGFAMGGTGLLKIDGCSLYFEDMKIDHRVLASMNMCDMEGKAAIEVFAVGRKRKTGAATMQEFITDSNLRDNTTLCGPKK